MRGDWMGRKKDGSEGRIGKGKERGDKAEAQPNDGDDNQPTKPYGREGVRVSSELLHCWLGNGDGWMLDGRKDGAGCFWLRGKEDFGKGLVSSSPLLSPLNREGGRKEKTDRPTAAAAAPVPCPGIKIRRRRIA